MVVPAVHGLVSLQTMTEEGETVEVAMIGNEGVVGLACWRNVISQSAHCDRDLAR